MKTVRHISILVGALLLTAGAALAGEGGIALKADDVKAEPFRDATTVGPLAPGDQVEILKKQGGWFQVKSATGTGWVRMLSIRRGAARKDGGDPAGLLGLASGRAGTGRVVATTGIRGLSEEELKGAAYNEAELKKAESYVTTRSAAQQFAVTGKLVPRKVDYLPVPGPGK